MHSSRMWWAMPIDLTKVEFGTDLMAMTPIGGLAEAGEILTVVTRPARGWVTMINLAGERIHVNAGPASKLFERIDAR